jgi:Tfp pilus assembly protein PilF
MENPGSEAKRQCSDRLPRRKFLAQGAAAALMPAGLSGLALFPGLATALGTESEFHLRPHYREATPLDALLVKKNASLDDFVTEKYHDRIAAILAKWSANLRQSPQGARAIESALASDFLGSSMRPSGSEPLRSDAILEVRRFSFTETSIGPETFREELRHYMSEFREILTAEFQVTKIDADSQDRLRTIVRYELVGTAKGFYREQRVGIWDLQWHADSSGEYRLQRWKQMGETRARSAAPVFEDRTEHVLAGNHSYSAQLAHGVDYWRTVLDGACGIDIYGHNGVSVGDIDGRGFDDLYVCQPAGLPNRLYRNRGDGTFEDITETSGVGVLENTACAIFADFDNDGRQDLLVVRANGPLLFLNEGGGKFRPKPDALHFASTPQGTFTGAAAADYDRDGWLDIYFCLYVYYQGTDQYKYPAPYYDANNGPPNFLMRNNRDGTFRDVTAESGLNRNNTRYSFCCGWTDCNQDGWPDLYVANDFGRKNLYRNNGDGTFTDIADQAGVEDIGAGMSVCSFDYDNDGTEDLYVADMWTAAGERIASQEAFQKSAPPRVRGMYRKHAMGNSLFRNAGNGHFQDKTAIADVGMGRWSWSSDAWDFDHDGFPDVYVTNGMVSGPLREDLNSFFWRQVVAKSPSEAKPSDDYEQGWNAVNELIRSDYSWSGYERNVFYANNRDGTFSDVSGAVGLDFMEDGRAFALADFDNDGRLEVLLKNRNGPQVRFLKNVVKDLPPSICFHLRGTKSNRDAIGAAITVETVLGRQTRMLQAGSGFLSQQTKAVFFGLGEAKGPYRATIRWPGGLVQNIGGIQPNHRIFVEEGSEQFRSEAFQRPSDIASMPAAPEGEELPDNVETWLLSPVTAPDFPRLSAFRGKPVLLNFGSTGSKECQDDLGVLQRLQGLQSLTVNCDGSNQDVRDTVAIYNLLYRSLFDRHRDLRLPTSLLIDEKGEIVKIYRGPLHADRVLEDVRRIPRSAAERTARALPFPSAPGAFTFGRNYLSSGSIFFQRGYLDQAEASFELALRDDPSSAEALYGLGSVYLKQAKTTDARASFERAVKLKASYPDTLPNAWNNLGLLATQEGNTGAAIGYFQEALRLKPEHLISLENLGNAFRQEKRWDEARTTLERAFAIRPENPEINYSLGMVFAQANQPGRAYEYLQRALRYRPVYPEAINNLGVLYLRTQRRDEAVEEFKHGIQVAPDFDQSYLSLARVYVIEGDRDGARSILQQLLKRHPEHTQARKMLDELK